MKKNRLLLILFLAIFQTGTYIYSQKISNVNFNQERNNIIISYNLETKIPCKIALFVSTNGGGTWLGPLKKVSGDIGVNVSSGNKLITWNVLEEFEQFVGNNILFKVNAISNELQTVKIGSQEWTVKNLDVITYRNGDTIPEVKDFNEWSKLTTGAWCYYDNDPKNGKIYGKLYNWYAVNDPRGLAPEGYHIPSEDEWKELINFLGGIKKADVKMKEIGFTYWKKPIGSIYYTPTTTPANNSSNFTALPGGNLSKAQDHHNRLSNFDYIGEETSWWSSSKNDRLYGGADAFAVLLDYYHNYVYYQVYDLYYGNYVRCIKN